MVGLMAIPAFQHFFPVGITTACVRCSFTVPHKTNEGCEIAKQGITTVSLEHGNIIDRRSLVGDSWGAHKSTRE